MRIDKQDNIWIVDKGSNVILKMNPQGRVVWVFGRKGESSHLDVPPDYASQLDRSSWSAPASPSRGPPNNNPRNPVPVHRDNVFNQPTDVAWDSQGNSYFSDGYINSRVGKANARGEWVASWGSLGNGPGQFDTPHGIAVSPKDEIYVADRGNRRIQVFDTKGKYLREFTIDVPVDTESRQDHLRRGNPELQDRIDGARRARCAVHDTRARTRSCSSAISIRAASTRFARRQGARRLWSAGPQPRRVRLDPRDRVSVGK